MSEERIAALQQLLVQEPDDTMLLFGLGNDYAQIGRDAEAIASFERALQVDPEYAAVYVRLAWVYERLRQTDKVREVLTRGRGAIERSGDRNLMAEMEEILDLL